MQEVELGLAQISAWTGQRLLLGCAVGEQQAHIVGRRAGDDAVEIGRKALGFHQGLAATVGTAHEIGEFKTTAFLAPALLRRDQRLGNIGGLLQGAPAVVDDLLGVAERPGGRGPHWALVAVVGAGDRIAPGRQRLELS